MNIQVWEFNLKKLEVAIGCSAKTRLLHNGADPDVLDDGGNSDLNGKKESPKKG